MCVRALEVWPRQTPGTEQWSATFHLLPQKYARGEFIHTRHKLKLQYSLSSRQLVNAEIFIHTHTHTCADTQANSHYRRERQVKQWAPPPHPPLSFCLSPWWCVMFRGDNRCHSETPLVSALWGTLMTHTHTQMHTHTPIQPCEHRQLILWTLRTTDDSPLFSPFSTSISLFLSPPSLLNTHWPASFSNHCSLGWSNKGLAI